MKCVGTRRAENTYVGVQQGDRKSHIVGPDVGDILLGVSELSV